MKWLMVLNRHAPSTIPYVIQIGQMLEEEEAELLQSNSSPTSQPSSPISERDEPYSSDDNSEGAVDDDEARSSFDGMQEGPVTFNMNGNEDSNQASEFTSLFTQQSENAPGVSKPSDINHEGFASSQERLAIRLLPILPSGNASMSDIEMDEFVKCLHNTYNHRSY